MSPRPPSLPSLLLTNPALLRASPSHISVLRCPTTATGDPQCPSAPGPRACGFSCVVTPAAALTQVQPTQEATRAMAPGGCPESGQHRTHPPPWCPHTSVDGSLTDHPPCDCPVSPAAALTTSGHDPGQSLPSRPAHCLHDNPKGAPAARGLGVVSWPFRKPTRLQGPGSVIAFPSPESHAPRAGSFRKARPERTGLRSPRPGAKAQRSHQRPGPLLGSGAGGVTSRGRCRRSRVLGQAAPWVPGSRGRRPVNPAVARTSAPLASHSPPCAHPRSAAPEPGPAPPSMLPPGALAQTPLGPRPRSSPSCLPASGQPLRVPHPGTRPCTVCTHPPNLQEVGATPALQGLPPTQ